MKTPLYAVIMAGGRGARFWPLSRAHRPKQLLSLLSPKTLVRETVDRVLPIFGPENLIIVTVAEHFDAMRDELSFLPARNFLVEPIGNNTAPCIGLAALEIERRHPRSVMAVLPADHSITGGTAFRRTLKLACRIATRNEELLITLGVPPEHPETGFGYILKGSVFTEDTGAAVHRVKRFKEKPNVNGAKRIIKAGGLWNSGIFVWRAATILKYLAAFEPVIADSLNEIAQKTHGKSLTTRDKRTRALLHDSYRRMSSISIDHAVLETAARKGHVVTVSGDFTWNDVGSWSALHRLLNRDQQGNGGHARWLSVNSRDCLLFGQERLVVLLGVDSLAVIDTPDALLVANLEQSQDLKEIVQLLKSDATTRHLLE